LREKCIEIYRQEETPVIDYRGRLPERGAIEMAKRGQVPVEDLHPMRDEVAAAKGVSVRVVTDSTGKRSAVLVPVAFARLSQEAVEVVADLQREALRLQEIRERVEALVIESRDVGASWAVIGWSVGTSESAARKRWGQS